MATNRATSALASYREMRSLIQNSNSRRYRRLIAVAGAAIKVNLHNVLIRCFCLGERRMNDSRPAERRRMRQKHGNVNAVNKIASDKRHGSHCKQNCVG